MSVLQFFQQLVGRISTVLRRVDIYDALGTLAVPFALDRPEQKIDLPAGQ